MATNDVTITPANVKPTAVATELAQLEKAKYKIAGEAIEIFEAVRYDAVDKDYLLADNNAGGGAQAVAGISFDAAGVGEAFRLLTNGMKVDLGATLEIGWTYYLSDTPGKLIPAQDLASGMNVVRLGYAESDSIFVIDILDYGVAVTASPGSPPPV